MFQILQKKLFNPAANFPATLLRKVMQRFIRIDHMGMIRMLKHREVVD